MNELAIYKRRFERERQARKQAEAILESKALALYNANEKLRKLNESLEQKVIERTEQLARSEDKYRGIIESMELGLLEVDLNHNIKKAYQWFCDMTGYNPEELEGQNAKKIFLPNQKIHVEIAGEEEVKRARGQAGVYEIQMQKKNGDLIWVLVSGAPVTDMQGVIVGSIGIHYDITARKELEEELKTAKSTAEAAQEAEKQFLARMSHEIRTPLNAIIGMTHLLYDTKPNIQQRDYLDGLRTSADILLKLISDILDISKIGAGEVKVNEQEFDLSGVLWALQKTFQLKSKKHAIDVLVEIDDDIEYLLIGDELLLNQILLNLIGNAIKFTDRGSVGVHVKKGRKIDTRTIFEFEVFDTGIGIPPEEIHLVFERFKQAKHKEHYRKDGTGLGLAICKQLVELQGGKITVESEWGVGTSFKFYLPLIETDKNASLIPHNQYLINTDFKSDQRLLIVEDNLMNQKYIINLLKKWEIQYELANNGLEAVEKAKASKFDLILMDLSMPLMNGYEATILIRNHRNLNQFTPIIALTASALISQKNKAFSVGMNDFLAKPFNPNQLQLVIERYTIISEIEVIKKDAVANEFQFSQQLDDSYLKELYGEDLEYAADMFETFLDYSVKELPILRPLIEAADFEKSRQLAHKLKPTFAMVGLVDLQQKMLKIETMASEKEAVLKILLELDVVEQQLQILTPVLQTQLKEMQAII